MASAGEPPGRPGNVVHHDRRERHVGRRLDGLAFGEGFKPRLEDSDGMTGEYLGRTQYRGRQFMALDRLLDGKLLRPVLVLGTCRGVLRRVGRFSVEHLTAGQKHKMRPAVGKPAHQFDRVRDIDLPRERRILLAGPHVGDRRAEERKAIARALEWGEIGIPQVEEEAVRSRAP